MRSGRLWVAAMVVVRLSGAQTAAVEISGSVRDESGSRVEGAHVTIRSADPAVNGSWEAESAPDGAFSLTLPSPGDYLASVSREGFYLLKDQPVHAGASQPVELTIIAVQEVFQSVDVKEQPSPVDIDQSQNQERLSGTEINDILYPNSHSLVNSMKLMPGVVEDPGGGMHFYGSSPNQVSSTF